MRFRNEGEALSPSPPGTEWGPQIHVFTFHDDLQPPICSADLELCEVGVWPRWCFCEWFPSTAGFTHHLSPAQTHCHNHRAAPPRLLAGTLALAIASST